MAMYPYVPHVHTFITIHNQPASVSLVYAPIFRVLFKRFYVLIRAIDCGHCRPYSEGRREAHPCAFFKVDAREYEVYSTVVVVVVGSALSLLLLLLHVKVGEG